MIVLYKYSNLKYKLVVQKDKKEVQKKDFPFLVSDNEENDPCRITVTSPQELRRIQISRTKRMIYEYSFCNDFKFFGTITFNSKNCNRYSLDETFKLLRKTINQMKNKYHWKRDDFRYLIICEEHKDGAYHFHGLFSDVLANDLYINDNLYLSSNYFDNCGFNSWSIIENKEACACYIQKYITKDFISSIGGTTYICSRGLKCADRYIIDDLKDFKSFDNFDFENDFVKIKDIDLYHNPDLTFYFAFICKYNDNYILDYEKNTAQKFIDKILTKIRKNDNVLIT